MTPPGVAVAVAVAAVQVQVQVEVQVPVPVPVQVDSTLGPTACTGQVSLRQTRIGRLAFDAALCRVATVVPRTAGMSNTCTPRIG